MGIDEHYEQISPGGHFGGARGCAGVAASVFTRLQPEEVYPTSTLCLLGSQGFFEDRLSRLGVTAGGLSEFDRGHPAAKSSSLYDVAKSRASLVGSSSGSSLVGDHGSSAHEAQEACPARGHGFDRTGVEPGQPVLCPTPGSDGKPVEKHGLSSLSQTGGTVQNRFAFRAGISKRSGAVARRRGLSTSVERRAPAGSIDDGDRGRRLRLGSQPRVWTRGLSDPHDHSCQARTTRRQAGSWPLPSTDANPVRHKVVPQSMSGRNRDVDDQTPPRIVPPEPNLLEPVPRPPLESPHPQHHDSQT